MCGRCLQPSALRSRICVISQPPFRVSFNAKPAISRCIRSKSLVTGILASVTLRTHSQLAYQHNAPATVPGQGANECVLVCASVDSQHCHISSFDFCTRRHSASDIETDVLDSPGKRPFVLRCTRDASVPFVFSSAIDRAPALAESHRLRASVSLMILHTDCVDIPGRGSVTCGARQFLLASGSERTNRIEVGYRRMNSNSCIPGRRARCPFRQGKTVRLRDSYRRETMQQLGLGHGQEFG